MNPTRAARPGSTGHTTPDLNPAGPRAGWHPSLKKVLYTVFLTGGLLAALIGAAVAPPLNHLWDVWFGKPSPSTQAATPPATPPTTPPAEPPPTGLTATIECVPACTTDKPVLALRGTISGTIPAGHTLRLMIFDNNKNAWYPDNPAQVQALRWSGQVHTGPVKPPSTEQPKRACLVDAGPAFEADLKALSVDVERVNLDGLSRAPEPMPQVACIAVLRR